jgi:menaquinone-9 beta-reductase
MASKIISSYEIIIIGGGPAGVSTALHLAKIAPHLVPKIIILEKSEYPRPKLCAGGLTVDAEFLLERLGFDVNEIPVRLAGTVSLEYEGKGFSLNPKKQHALKVILREEFDEWLAIKARTRGIEIRENTLVKNVRAENGMVTVETNHGTFQVKAVVGADGSKGITRDCILPDQRLRTARLLEFRWNEEPGSDQHNDTASFDFTPISAGISGYTWDFPSVANGEFQRCLGIFDNNLMAGRSRQPLRDALLQDLRSKQRDPREVKLQGHPLRLFNPFKPFSIPGVLLVGDSAGSDPLFGEGISLALGYGFIAAKTIKKSFEKNNYEFKNYKWAVLGSSLGQTLFIRKIIAEILYTFDWPWFQRVLWHVFKPIVKIAGWIFVLNWAKRLK